MSLYQEEDKIIDWFDNTEMYLNDSRITASIKKVLETMWKGEIAWGEISPSWLVEFDQQAISKYQLDDSKPFFFNIELLDFERVIDWYHD